MRKLKQLLKQTKRRLIDNLRIILKAFAAEKKGGIFNIRL